MDRNIFRLKLFLKHEELRITIFYQVFGNRVTRYRKKSFQTNFKLNVQYEFQQEVRQCYQLYKYRINKIELRSLIIKRTM